MIKLIKSMLASFVRKFRRKEELRSLRRNIKEMDGIAQEICYKFQGKGYLIPKLNHDELSAVRDFWSKYSKIPPDDSFYRLAKFAFGFSKEFVPESMLYTLIQWNLNDAKEARIFEDKGLYGFYFSDLKRPREVVKCYRGIFFSESNKCISEADAIQAVISYGEPFIIKPSRFSEQGRNVQRIDSYDHSDLPALFDKYGKDFVVQGVIQQCGELAALNRTSVNCIRITSLLLNGKYSCLSSTIKVGGRGLAIDNVGAGGFLVGVHSDGRLYSKGFDAKGNVVESTYDGVPLKSIVVPSFDRVLDFASILHTRVPQLPFLGIDIAVDIDGEPVFVEMNAYSPGVVYEQMCTGPIFADRLQEVLEYINKGKRK